MRLRTLIVLGLAIVFGVVAVLASRVWLEGQRTFFANASRSPTDTIVVAARPLRFGDLVRKDHVKEIPWAAGNRPPGSFKNREELVGSGSKEEERFVLSAIEPDEPILAWKITGPGQRATLSNALTEGMKAVTIRVNDILGVAGFVLPGDRVDVLLTRGDFVDVLLQGVKVLAIDQTADDRRDKPAVVRAVTFEVSTEEAQKLTLAATVGQLSLTLRNKASAEAEETKRVKIVDLDPQVATTLEKAALKAADAAPVGDEPEAPRRQPIVKKSASNDFVIGVSRNMSRSEYRVEEQDNDSLPPVSPGPGVSEGEIPGGDAGASTGVELQREPDPVPGRFLGAFGSFAQPVYAGDVGRPPSILVGSDAAAPVLAPAPAPVPRPNPE